MARDVFKRSSWSVLSPGHDDFTTSTTIPSHSNISRAMANNDVATGLKASSGIEILSFATLNGNPMLLIYASKLIFH